MIRRFTITWMLVASTALANPRIDPSQMPGRGIPGRVAIRAPEVAVAWFEGCGHSSNASATADSASWETPPMVVPIHECALPPQASSGGSDWGITETLHLRFQDEWLYIDVKPPLAHIRGVYGFEFLGSGPFRMTFPLPACTTPTLDSLTCVGPDGRSVPIRPAVAPGAWTWAISGGGPGRYVIEVCYRQPIVDGVIHYLLSSAQSWPEPIGRAQVVITTPQNGWLHSSYRLHPWATRGVCTFVMDAVNFKPKRDLILTWETLSGESGFLEGGVTDERGSPIAFASVEVLGQGKGAMSQETGLFRIGGVQPGTYTVQVSCLGYSRAVDNVVVLSGSSTEIEVVLNTSPEW